MVFDQNAFGRVIRRLRKQKKQSQEVLSGFAVIPRPYLSELEHGKRNCYLDTFCKLAEALEMRPSELMRLVEEEIESATDR